MRFETLVFTTNWFEEYERLSNTDRRRFRRALALLETNEGHPSLRVHSLHGKLEGVWSASASDSLRMTFERLSDGRKALLTCSNHYGD